MIPVMCNCANNKAGVCYGKANTAYIEDVMSNIIPVTACPGYIAIGQDAYAGEIQGDRKIGKDGQTKL